MNVDRVILDLYGPENYEAVEAVVGVDLLRQSVERLSRTDADLILMQLGLTGRTWDILKDWKDYAHAGNGHSHTHIAHIVPVDFAILAGHVEDRDQWLLEPVLPARRRVLIFSVAGVGKSLLNLYMAACLASGRPVLHRIEGDPIHVVYVDSEMTDDDLAERLDDMGFDYTHDVVLQEHLHYYLHPDMPPLDTKEGGEALLAVCQRDDAVYAFVDTVTSQTAGDENSADTYRNMGRYTTAKLVAAGIGVCILDHEGKDPGKGARGSSAKRDPADVIWRLTKGINDSFELRQKKRRMGWVPEFVSLRLEEGPLRFTMPIAQITAEATQLVKALEALEVPTGTGRPTCANALREGQVPFATTALAEAVRWRKRLGQSARTAVSDTSRTVPQDSVSKNAENRWETEEDSQLGQSRTVGPSQLGQSSLPKGGQSRPDPATSFGESSSADDAPALPDPF